MNVETTGCVVCGKALSEHAWWCAGADGASQEIMSANQAKHDEQRETVESLVGLVLLFHTATDPSRAARLHAADCPMVNTTKGRARVVKLIAGEPSYVLQVVEDLNESQFPVKRCRCCKRAEANRG